MDKTEWIICPVCKNKTSILRHGQNIFTDSISTLKDSAQYMDNGQFSLEKLYMELETAGAGQ